MRLDTSRILLAALCLLLAPIGLHAQSPSPDGSSTGGAAMPADVDSTWQALATDFLRTMEAGGHVGGTLWIAHEGDVLGKEHYGFSDLRSERRVDDQTIYHWASITKTLTGIAIMQLRDRGRLSLDDSVVDYLPSLREVHNPHGPMGAITIRMLLNHTAGFRSPTWPWAGDKEWHPHEPTRWSQLVAMMPYTQIHFEPGTKVKYSNPGYIFLGQIIEQVSGSEYETYIDKNIFLPLRMDRSYFDTTPRHLLDHRSNNYVVTAEGDTVANGPDFNTGITVANGGLNAPVGDMLRYASFLAGTCEWATCEDVLEPSSLREMWTPAPPQRETDDGGSGDQNEWTGYSGLSFFVLQQGDVKVVHHTGGQKAYTTLLMLEPEADVAAAIAFNSERGPDAGEDADPSASSVLREMQRRLITDVFPLFR